MKNHELIKKLSLAHRPKPFWKNRAVLLAGWISFTLLYYTTAMIFFSRLDPHATWAFLALGLVTSVLGWVMFSQRLNDDGSGPSTTLMGVGAVLGLLGTAFIYDEWVAHSILHERSLSLVAGDLSCHGHTLAVAILPLCVSAVLSRFFFVAQKRSAALFLAVHVTALSVLWTEMSCPDREFWHLLLGHQASVVGVFGIAIFLMYLSRVRASSIS